MDCSYDEIISENVFYRTLLDDHRDLFAKGVTEGCILCVPRSGSISECALSLDVFCAHILVPSEELPESHFVNIRGEEVRICNRVVTVDHEVGHQSRVHVLFEETFYCDDGSKYKILCIEKPIRGKKDSSCRASNVITLSTLRECIDFLWIESGSAEITEKINRLATEFAKSNADIDECDIEAIADRARSLYVQCVQTALKCPRVGERAHADANFVSNVKIAVETCVQQGIYAKVMKGISTQVAHEDANLNKILRNASDLKIQDFDINPRQYDAVLSAKFELSKIDSYSTVLGKSRCLKKMFAAICECGDSSDGSAIGADDVLQILIFLIIKIGLPNWNAQLRYLKLFRFSASPNVHDEACFLVTSLEAAIEHLQSGTLLDFSDRVEGNGETIRELKSVVLKAHRVKVYDEESSLRDFYKAISLGDLEQVKRMIDGGGEEEEETDVLPALCHPLCVCPKCKSLAAGRRGSSRINSQDGQGLAPLHIASMYCKSSLVEFLLASGADPDKADVNGLSAIHYAAMQGHQNGLLLLAYADADINALDYSSNTPLHFCSNNGHENCVKALIYFSENSGVELDVNARNSGGDTPLHNASRWGYLGIVKTLLENGADPAARNNRRLSPVDVAHNSKVLDLLAHPCSDTRNYVRIIPFKPMFDHAEEAPPPPPTTATATTHAKQRVKGTLPGSEDSLKKLETALKAIRDGDKNLACFYLGLDASESVPDAGLPPPRERCHPLCTCTECGASSDEDDVVDPATDSLGVNHCNTDGLTALHVAAAHGRADLCRLLVRNGALLDARTRLDLRTPLMLACRHERVNAVRVLLGAGCDVDVQDADGNTALHHACLARNNKIVELLVAYDPDARLRNNRNKTPLQEARESLSIGMMKALRSGNATTSILLDDALF